MVRAKVSVEKTKGPTLGGILQMSGVSVVVGIPKKNQTRRGGGIDNASLLFIFSNGSPLRRIPPRPVIEPAIEANKEPIDAELQQAVSAAAENDPEGVMRAMNRAGMVAANAAKQWFFDSRNGWAPNKPSTIARKGSEQPGIDTGQMRRAITYVVVGQFQKGPEQKQKKGKSTTDEEAEKNAREAGKADAEAAQGGIEELAEGAAEAAEAAGELAVEGGEILLL